MGRDDWYRNKRWTSRIKKAFFEKLSRARTQRDQYLVIQAGLLNRRYYKEALELIELYFDTRTDKFHDTSALSIRASALFKLKRRKEAIEAYRAVLAREEECPNISSGMRVGYPYLVATNRMTEEYEYALVTLDKYPDAGPFPLQQFMWHAAKALIEENPDHAKTALAVAKVRKSGMRFHQDLGLVGKEHKATIRRLLKIST